MGGSRVAHALRATFLFLRRGWVVGGSRVGRWEGRGVGRAGSRTARKNLMVLSRGWKRQDLVAQRPQALVPRDFISRSDNPPHYDMQCKTCFRSAVLHGAQHLVLQGIYGAGSKVYGPPPMVWSPELQAGAFQTLALEIHLNHQGNHSTSREIIDENQPCQHHEAL